MWGRFRPFSGQKAKKLLCLCMVAIAIATAVAVPTAVFATPPVSAAGTPAAPALAAAAVAPPGEVIVEFAPGTRGAAMNRAASLAGAALQGAHVGWSKKSMAFAVYRSGSLTTEELLERFKNVPGVVAVAANNPLRLSGLPAVPSPSLLQPAGGASAQPNDPAFANQWALENTGQVAGVVDADIDALTAWERTTGSADAVVAVIDSGVDYNHPDLAGNMWTNKGEIPGDGLDNDGNGYVDDVYGIDAANSDSDPLDDNGHGTHVAGIIAAVGNNGIGVTGVAWKAQIMALKAFAGGYGDDSRVIECIDYAIHMKLDHGVNITAINASFEGVSYNSVAEDWIQAAGDAGIIFCAAAGNSYYGGRNIDITPSYPAAYDCSNIIAVGASDTYDARADFSNYGAATVDLFAPGVNVVSTYPPYLLGPYAPPYKYESGTSMAAPLVAGTVALLATAAPFDTVSARIDRILSTVDTPAGLAGKCVTNGRLNAGAAVAGCPVVYQQSDSRLTYLGSWSYAAQAPASGGSFNHTSLAGAALSVSFTGTSFALLAKTSYNYGQALVSLDGGPEESVDFYSPTALYQQRVYQKEGLGDTAHTLTMKWAGLKNDSSTGYLVNVDALEIMGTLTEAPKPTRYQQDDSNFTYSGVWGKSWTWSASGGSFTYAGSAGAAVNVKFDGTYLAWYAKTGPQYGKARVSLDGGELFDIDLYSAGSAYKRCVYSTGKLTEGTHTLSIYWSGLKHARSTGYLIDVDTFDVLGILTTAPAAPPTPTRYQQSDSRLTYLGSWSYAAQAPASGGSFNHTSLAGAALSVSFTGTSFALLAKTSYNYGQALVSLDGGPEESVDFYSPTALYQQRVYQKEGLGDTAHTLTMKWAGLKNDSSTGYLVNVDALEIMGTLTEAPKPTRYQQDDSNFTYSGVWGKSWTWSASGGSFTYAGSAGAAVNVKFDGTYLAWYAKTGPWYGKATVSLDSGPAFEVDLYSTSTLWKKQVYNTGLLVDGTHTLSICWSGLKNAASSGYLIDVDTFDILGTPVATTP